MFYPNNFPRQFERPLIEMLFMIEREFRNRVPTDGNKFNRLILDALKNQSLHTYFKDLKPSSWWLHFVLLRHETKFPSKFVKQIRPFLIKTKTRSISGIVALTLFTKGTGCPFFCVYCPNEPGMPKSYLSDEPAVMRAVRNNFDSYKQTLSRLIMFYLSNHPISKVEIIIKGGTFSFYEKAYRKRFVKRIFDACNTNIEELIKKGNTIKASAGNLIKAQAINESASSRIIGINIETRPDYINAREITFLRTLGVTHVEIGVQMPNDTIYETIKRGHRVSHVIAATKLLKDAGFKVGYHLMPNLPGATALKDFELMKKVFENEAFKPDHLKLYPTTVTPHATLCEWYKTGKYVPYPLDKMIVNIIRLKSEVIPPWVRIGRLTRDITTDMMEYKQFAPNLREIIQKQMHEKKLLCKCIRCREIRGEKVEGKPLLRIIQYEASGGREYFLEYIDEAEHSLGFLRLRIPQPSNALVYCYTKTSMVRELHVYGQSVPVGEKREEEVQHKSLGSLLLKKAEELSIKMGFKKIMIISGVGVRKYYRKKGYQLENTYMIKKL